MKVLFDYGGPRRGELKMIYPPTAGDELTFIHEGITMECVVERLHWLVDADSCLIDMDIGTSIQQCEVVVYLNRLT